MYEGRADICHASPLQQRGNLQRRNFRRQKEWKVHIRANPESKDEGKSQALGDRDNEKWGRDSKKYLSDVFS